MNSFLKIFSDNEDSEIIDKSFDEVENEESAFQEIIDQKQEAAMLCIKKPHIPNFFFVVHANKSLYDLFEVGEEDIVGKSYDFFCIDADLDSCAEDQLEYGRLIKAVRDNHECSVVVSAASGILNEHESGLHINFTPQISANNQRSYGIFSFIKVKKFDNKNDENSLLAMSNVALLKTLERSLNSEKLLREIANMIIAESSIEVLANQIAKLLCENLKSDRCVVYKSSEGSSTLVAEFSIADTKKMLQNSQESKQKLLRYIEFHNEFYRKFCDKEKKVTSLNVQDLSNDKNFQPIYDIASEFNINSQLVTTIVLHDKICGGICLHLTEYRVWNEEEIRVIEMVAKQLSIAIDRFDSVEKTRIANQILTEKTMQLEESLRHEQEVRKVQNEFVALVSHEFKTPLQVIDSTREIVWRKFRNLKIDDDSIFQSLERIKSGIHRMNGLIDSTLNLAQIENGGKIKAEMSNFNLNQLLHDVIDKNFGLAQQRKIEVYCRIDELPKSYFSDPKMLEHIFTNIISNAIKYSNGGSDIKIVAKETSQNYAVRIVDSGIGIPSDEIKNIGQKFFRASNSRYVSGTGIGLYLTKFFTELLGGIFLIDSQKDVGTSVTIALPKS